VRPLLAFLKDLLKVITAPGDPWPDRPGYLGFRRRR
jgi:hypothetical protein